jgi:hypothetical protein
VFRLLACHREPEANSGAAGTIDTIEQLNTAAMLFENFSDDCEPEPGATFSRRHVGFQQTLATFGGETFAIVGHINRNNLIVQ